MFRTFLLLAALLIALPLATGAMPAPADLERLCREGTALRADASHRYRPGRDAYGRPVPPADLRAGTDAYGRAVVPADLDGGSGVVLPPQVQIDVTRRLGSLVPGLEATGIGNSDVSVGTVVVGTDGGRARYEGQPLDRDEAAAGTSLPAGSEIRRICRLRYG